METDLVAIGIAMGAIALVLLMTYVIVRLAGRGSGRAHS